MAAASLDDWRALVAQGGSAVDKLVHTTAEGLRVQPLYVEGPAADAATRGLGGAARFGVCMRSDAAHVAEDVDGGADALWLNLDDKAALAIAANGRLRLVLDEITGRAKPDLPPELRNATSVWMSFDPIASVVSGAVDLELCEKFLLPGLVQVMRFADAHVRTMRVSTLAAHDAGADAADELALALATCVAYLQVIDNVDQAARQLWLQIAVGRDTFGELCKLRALRTCMHKLLAAAGAPDVMPPIHAVCSSRTLTEYDAPTNMLRGTTQIFAAALGGAELITPLPFDASPHARRVARNAALVLREESHLGRVVDPAGGSYYIESRTDALAREAWSRFQAIEAGGGIVPLIASGALHQRLDASWAARAAAIAKRKEPILGVSEFANPGDGVTHVTFRADAANPGKVTSVTPSPAHRDSEGFEALRARAQPTSVTLVTLGPPSEARARVGFATALFATAGLRVHEASEAARADVAVLCGSDERYASEAAAKARELRAGGACHVVLAGRPGALEAELRAAGVDQFIFIGCDVLAVLAELTR